MNINTYQHSEKDQVATLSVCVCERFCVCVCRHIIKQCMEDFTSTPRLLLTPTVSDLFLLG